MSIEEGPRDPKSLPQVKFSHIQLYVKYVEDIDVYKDLEGSLCDFSAALEHKENENLDLPGKRRLWQSICAKHDKKIEFKAFTPQNRDVIKQLLVGFGMRVTGFHRGYGTKSLLVTTKDPSGVQIVVTAKDSQYHNVDFEDSNLYHLQAVNLDRYFERHSGRQGIAVLGFRVDNVKSVYARYKELHPLLIHSYRDGPMAQILEVFAYYNHDVDYDDSGRESKKEPDTGTLIRFVEIPEESGGTDFCILPGLEKVSAAFDNVRRLAYFDHWVSNVFSRTEFLGTLHDTLGFEPKVDFNAGVIAAGEAQIESTVTGNDSTLQTSDKTIVLRDQSQVYLPINNALSPVGHVHGFLEEIGQGIQHVANRVENLVDFVSRCNDYREITGEGFAFLDIPRSYYGVLSLKYLAEEARISTNLVEEVIRLCSDEGITTCDGAVDLELSKESLRRCLDWKLGELESYVDRKEDIIEAILSSRYCNLRSLLRDHVSESTYLSLVKNRILCDVQGQDVLYQIFTCKILFEKPGDEAPFFEFIQRVCSEGDSKNACTSLVKPGCGGFGIRNFLTLFLSIEVTKAIREMTDARSTGDEIRRALAEKKVDYFSNQLNESNPILTRISDAMTEEAICASNLKNALVANDQDAIGVWKARKAIAEKKKIDGNDHLMECSHRYGELMRRLREESKLHHQ